MIDVEQRLRELGDRLAIDDADLSAAVAEVVSVPLVRPARIMHVRVAAIVLLVAVAAVLILPSARDAVAGWLGLERVEIERRDDLIVPSIAPPVTVPAGTSPIGEQIDAVDGTAVLLGMIDGRLSDVFIAKTVAADAPVVSLEIDGMPALWIAEPHEVVIERDGLPVVERVAGATLLWQDGDVLWRVEGFATSDAAIAYVRSR